MEVMRLKFTDGVGWVVKDPRGHHPEYLLFPSKAAATKFAADCLAAEELLAANEEAATDFSEAA